MKNRNFIKPLFLTTSLVLGSAVLVGCNNSDDDQQIVVQRPADILSSTAWETTAAKNAAGEQVPLSDANVMNFVGYADFKADATFQMWNLDGSAKMQGTWSLSADGKTRTINAMNDKGEVLFSRVVDITVLNNKEFTYRIYPDANNKAVYYDIVHTPVSQKVVGSSILSSTTWETTAAVNQAGQNLPLNDREVINFVGYADFYLAGNFIMTNLDGSPKLNGTWLLSDDAKQRTIHALNPQGEVLFTRVVDITVLTPQEFTYRIYPVAADQTQYIDIVHTPVKK